MTQWEKALAEFEANKKAWDDVFKLPTVPIHNNPWLYCAYAFKILKGLDIPDAFYLPLRTRVRERLRACKLSTGYYHKYPGGRGGLMSHDEILGIAWLDMDAAREIYFTLVMNDGIYENEPVAFEESANVFRIFWVKYAIQGLAGARMSLITQAKFGLFLIADALIYKDEGDASRLRFWLVEDLLDRVSGSWLLGLAFLFWNARMNKKRQSPKSIFQNHYLKEVEEFGIYAPDRF